MRKYIPIKKKIFERDNYQCVYCQSPLDRPTIDHVIPLSKGGSYNRSCNLVTCCEACNKIKSSLTVEDFCRRKRINAVLIMRRFERAGVNYFKNRKSLNIYG